METDIVVSDEWVAEHLDDGDVVIVDVRPPQFYMQAHLPGAVNLPVYQLSGPDGRAPAPATLARQLGSLGISRDSHVIAYDDGASPAAARLFWALRYLQHARASVLDGGITAWRHGGRDWDYAPVVPTPVDYATTPPDESVNASLDRVMAALDSDVVALLDVRSPGEYLALQTTARRKGHIAGAINVDWSNNLRPEDDGTYRLRPRAELRAIYLDAGVTPDKHVIVYCQSGGRAAETYMVLTELGYPHVSIYNPGWQEWGNRADTPIEE